MTHDTAHRQLEDSVWAIEIPHSPYADRTRELIVDALHAEGYRKHPKPEITDEMVDRAVGEYLNLHRDASGRISLKESMRAALNVAFRVMHREGEQ